MSKHLRAFKKLFFGCLLFISINAIAQPTITSFSPQSGPVGTSVIITGTNFNLSPTNNIVYFGAVKATVSSATTNSLTVIVPAGTTYQPISVLDNTTGLTAYSFKPFVITFTNPYGTGIPVNYYKPKVDFATDITPQTVVINDLDGDGKPDLGTSNFNNSHNATILRNISTTGIINTTSFDPMVNVEAGTLPNFLAIGDVDGDGKSDLVVANFFDNTVSVLRNISTSGSITVSSFAIKVDFATGTSPYSVTFGDLDGDGKPDLAVANYNSGTVSVLRNTSISGSLSFAPKVDFTAGANPGFVAIGDLDGDGKRELVVDNYPFGAFGIPSNSVSVFRNTSVSGSITTSSFAAKVDFTTGTDPQSVVIGDIDGDGKPDLVTSNYNTAAPTSGTVSVLRNTSGLGTISFEEKVDFATGNNPYTVAIGDLDGDSKPDLAVANYGSNTFSVLRNTSLSGTVSFDAKVDFTTGTGPQFIAIGDLDGDGVPEVTTANSNQNNVSVFQIEGSTLPINLSNFSVQKLNNTTALVQWKTSSEINSKYFDVERSNDAITFTFIGKVNAAGNSSREISYSFKDNQPLKGVNYYRLKQVDLDGHLNYSPARFVRFDDIDGLVKYYPNPTDGILNVEISPQMQKEAMVINISNASGIMMEQIKSQSNSTNVLMIDMKRFAKGTYFIQVKTNTTNSTQRIVLQ